MILAADLSQSAGPIGFLIVVLMAIATVFLIRNMDRRLKRLPRQFDPPEGEERDADRRP